MLLTLEQAIMLGYAVSSCECRTACDRELVDSPVQWTAKPVSPARSGLSWRATAIQAYKPIEDRKVR